MDGFLVSHKGRTSEWKRDFNMVQQEMNQLEKEGFVSNVNVSMFRGGILVKSFNYDFNGELWEKV